MRGQLQDCVGARASADQRDVGVPTVLEAGDGGRYRLRRDVLDGDDGRSLPADGVLSSPEQPNTTASSRDRRASMAFMSRTYCRGHVRRGEKVPV
ncbi:hypothetical protein RHA1_ro03797 [Rhodococcus jostii RHA1]|uniref:Uncharacterized protein n=1 Tax=Rhodococcus jostii (strain RHA1) TaxID=101510 RepID=Q0SA39_RHOJR|nr:hypothetical protein RHA1_ro03797 [Rhodococcus jostii RHA1]